MGPAAVIPGLSERRQAVTKRRELLIQVYKSRGWWYASFPAGRKREVWFAASPIDAIRHGLDSIERAAKN